MNKYLITILLLLTLFLSGCDKTTTKINDKIIAKELLVLDSVDDLENEQDVKSIFNVMEVSDIDLSLEELTVKVMCNNCNESNEYTTIKYIFESTQKEMNLEEVSILSIIFEQLLDVYHQDNYENKVYPILEITLKDYNLTIGDGGMGTGYYLEINSDHVIEQYLLLNSTYITRILNAKLNYKWIEFALNDGLLHLTDYDTLYGLDTRLQYTCLYEQDCRGNTEESIKELTETILDNFTFLILE